MKKHFLDCLIIKISCQEILNNTDNKYMNIHRENIEKHTTKSQLLDIANRKQETRINTKFNSKTKMTQMDLIGDILCPTSFWISIRSRCRID